ncbi:MAG: hypothetical protein WA837_03000 [Xanthobacteraceae bacterium]
MSSPVHHAKDIDPALIYAPPWAREQALSARSPVSPRFRTYEVRQRDFEAPHIADSRAYNAAIECAALCMMAINSGGNDPFRQNLREALREALFLRCGFHESNPFVDNSEVRNVLSDVVARTMSLSQQFEDAPECGDETAAVPDPLE